MSVGYIYILSNRSMPGLLKIGLTRHDVRRRAQELSSTGVPSPFGVEYYCLTADCEEVEASIHECFADCRAPGREFFSVGLREAVIAVDAAVRPVPPDRYCSLSQTALHPPPAITGSLSLPPEVAKLRGQRLYDAAIQFFANSRRTTGTLRLEGVKDATLWKGLLAARRRLGVTGVDVEWPAGGMVKLVRRPAAQRG